MMNRDSESDDSIVEVVEEWEFRQHSLPQPLLPQRESDNEVDNDVEMEEDDRY